MIELWKEFKEFALKVYVVDLALWEKMEVIR